MVSWTPVLWLPLLLASCGPDAGDYPFARSQRGDAGERPKGDAGPADAGPPAVPEAPLEDWDTADAGPLSGIFAVEVAVKARVVVEIEALQLYRMRLLQRGDDVRVLTTPCSVSLPSVEGVAELTVPAALQAVLPTKRVEARGTFLSSTDPIGATFAPPPVTILLGAALADPVLDALPTMEDPAAAVDEDGDGHPGVTVEADTVLCRQPELAYTAVRTSAGLDGVIDALDDFAGDVAARLEFSVLGTSDPCLSAAAALEVEILPGSRFRAVRMGDAQDLDGNGNISCPEIVWFEPRVFPGPPTP